MLADRVNDRIVATPGKTAHHPGTLQATQLLRHMIHNMVDAGVLQQQLVDVRKQRVLAVGLVQLLVALHVAVQQPGLLQVVQLHADGIGRLTKLRRQITQIRGGAAVQKELQQQADARLGCDQGLEHKKV